MQYRSGMFSLAAHATTNARFCRDALVFQVCMRSAVVMCS